MDLTVLLYEVIFRFLQTCGHSANVWKDGVLPPADVRRCGVRENTACDVLGSRCHVHSL